MDFHGFPKMARLSREVIITEKIDGTNVQVLIGEDGSFLIGSRTRWITPEKDNHGFARWAMEHYDELKGLGPGRHFGEWWGSGIQRNYGLKEKRFSLFNSIRWAQHGAERQCFRADGALQEVAPECCLVVPILYRGLMSLSAVTDCIVSLSFDGSVAAPGFMNPEGIVLYHIAAGIGFKKTIEKDEVPKGYKEK